MQFDLVVFGATSFVGKIVCRYLLERYDLGKGDHQLHWAIAARSKSKLADLIQELAADGLNTKGLEYIVADSGDEQSLKAMCEQAKVVISTVGPYALYGALLVKVCAELGSDYCDLTGEPQWVRKMLDAHEATAKASGARIVNCSGFDSIPSDMGVWFLQQQSRKRFKEPCESVRMRVKAIKGGASGGTIASLMNAVKEASTNPKLRQQFLDPYSLCAAEFAPKVKQPNVLFAQYDKDFQVWVAPFVMAAVNTRVVMRSHSLLNGLYGKSFTYEEAMVTGKGPVGRFVAMQYALGLGGFMAAAAIRPSRWVLSKLLPAPGEGPSKKAQESGFFDLRFVGYTASGNMIKTKVTGDRDPGYGSTAKMLSETALCLLESKSTGAAKSGFLTPATALGDALLERLVTNAGLRFEVLD